VDWWLRWRKIAKPELVPDGRPPDGDTVLRPGAKRWTTLYLSESARTDDRPLLTPGQAHRSSHAPWLNREPDTSP